MYSNNSNYSHSHQYGRVASYYSQNVNTEQQKKDHIIIKNTENQSEKVKKEN